MWKDIYFASKGVWKDKNFASKGVWKGKNFASIGVWKDINCVFMLYGFVKNAIIRAADQWKYPFLVSFFLVFFPTKVSFEFDSRNIFIFLPPHRSPPPTAWPRPPPASGRGTWSSTRPGGGWVRTRGAGRPSSKRTNCFFALERTWSSFPFLQICFFLSKIGFLKTTVQQFNCSCGKKCFFLPFFARKLMFAWLVFK